MYNCRIDTWTSNIFYLKSPFIHNKCGIMNCSIDNLRELIDCLRCSHSFDGQRKYPYLIVQVRHSHNDWKNRISKLMFHGGIFQYFSYMKPKRPEEQLQLVEFATIALSQLFVSSPNINMAAIIRVDILRTRSDRLFITEFETFNAFGVRSSTIVGECETETFLKNYWSNIIKSLLEQYL